MVQANHSRLNQSLLDAERKLSTQTIIYHQAVARYLKLHITDHKCLDILLGMGTTTAGQLAEWMGLTTGAITSVINRLENAGFVRRAKDANDLRIVIVEPNYENLRAVQEVFAPLIDAMTELHARYSPAEQQVILDYLEQSRQILARQTDKLRKKQ